jgi:GNAT superfamily N-acetyltransferase
MTPVVARLRSIADRQEEFRFRYRVYVDELGLRPREADHARRLLADELDRYARSYALVADGEIVGAVRLIFIQDLPDAGRLIERFSMGPALAFCGAAAICTTSRFIIDARFRGRKSMLLLMEEVFRDARSRGFRLNYGDCSASLLSFYMPLGYRAYAPSFDDPSYGSEIPLVMLADWRCFERSCSPLARVAREFPSDREALDWFEETYGEWSPYGRNMPKARPLTPPTGDSSGSRA